MGALLAHLDIQDVQLQNFGGVTELRGFLKALVAAPKFGEVVRSLGIMRDAEGNAAAAEASVQGALQAAGLPTPGGQLVQVGVAPDIRVVYLIIPPGMPQGMLETMCLASVAGDAAMPCVDQYFACLQAAGVAVLGNLEKAKVQAFLASRQTPGLLIGQAARAGYWPLGHVGFHPMNQLVNLL